MRAPLDRLRRRGRSTADETVWALKDVSFEVGAGEVIGIDWATLALSTVITLAVLLYAAYAFWRMEENFADIV